MIRVACFIAMLLVCHIVHAGNWHYQKPCYTCPPVHVAKALPQTSTVNSTAHTLTITNNYQFTQPTADPGNTAYGYPAFSASYRDIDLGALLTQYTRLTSDGQQGALALGDKLGDLLGVEGANRSRVAEILATGQAASQLAAAVKAPLQASASRTTVYQQGTAPIQQQQQNIGKSLTKTLAQNSLAYQTCGKCHQPAGVTATAEALAGWRVDGELSAPDLMLGIRSMIRDENPMPKGEKVPDETIGKIIKELAL